MTLNQFFQTSLQRRIKVSPYIPVLVFFLFFLILSPKLAKAEHGPIVDIPAGFENCETQRKECESKASGWGLYNCLNEYKQCLETVRNAGANQDSEVLYSNFGYVPPVKDLRQRPGPLQRPPPDPAGP